MAPETAIDPVMAETTGVSADEASVGNQHLAELSATERAYAMPYPMLAINPVDAGVMEPMAVVSDLDEAEPGPHHHHPIAPLSIRSYVASSMPASVLDRQPTMSDFLEVRIAEAEPGELQPVTERTKPEVDVRPLVAEVAAGPVAEAQFAAVHQITEIEAPEIAIDPATVDVVANSGLVEVELAVEIRSPELAAEPAFPEVFGAEVAPLVVPKDAESAGSGQGVGDDHGAHGLESRLVSDAWDAMTQAETVEMASPAEAGLELEPFVDVPITALAYQVDGIGTDPSVTSEPDEVPVSSVPTAGPSAELGITGTASITRGHCATDDADLKPNGLVLEDEVLGTEDQEETFTPPPALPVEEPQPAWMPLPRSPKFRWIRVAMQATEVSVPHDVFGGP